MGIQIPKQPGQSPKEGNTFQSWFKDYQTEWERWWTRTTLTVRDLVDFMRFRGSQQAATSSDLINDDDIGNVSIPGPRGPQGLQGIQGPPGQDADDELGFFSPPPAITQAQMFTIGITGAIPFFLSNGTLGQDATELFWDNTNKRLGVGTNAPGAPLVVSNNATALPAPIAGTVLQISNADAVTTRLLIDAFGAAPTFHGRRANNTAASPAALAANDTIFTLSVFGFGATGYSSSNRGGIIFNAAEAWTDAAQGSYITFNTTQKGTVSPASERARIDDAGNVIIGTAALATNATDGFLYISSCAGQPTGAATSYTGRIPTNWDSTNRVLYAHDGTNWVPVGGNIPMWHMNPKSQTFHNDESGLVDGTLTLGAGVTLTFQGTGRLRIIA